jgi:hypothetical protein
MVLTSKPAVYAVAAPIGQYLAMPVAELFAADSAAWHSGSVVLKVHFVAAIAPTRLANSGCISGPPFGARTANHQRRLLPFSTIETISIAAGIGFCVTSAGSAVAHRALKTGGKLTYMTDHRVISFF